MTQKKPVVITHSGSFHTDDLLAVAALDLLLDGNYTLIRTRDPEVIQTGDFIVDVGGVYDENKNFFDHHQEGGAGERENGIQYSSFGLVWKKYGEQLASSREVAEIIDQRVGLPVDAADNGIDTFTQTMEGVFPYLIHNVTRAFRPTWKEADRSFDEGFQEALVFAKRILEREILHAQHEIQGRELVDEAYKEAKDKRIIIIDDNYPWGGILSGYQEPLYVVKPLKQDANWQIEAVRDSVDSFTNRKNLPQAWAGKNGGELAQVTGVSDAVFCHNKLFTAVATSKEGALRLAQIAADA